MIRSAVLVAALTACSALADTQFFNATHEALRVDITMPNGEVKSLKLSGADPSAPSELTLYPPGVKQVPVVVFNDSNEQVWKGKVGVDDVWVLVPGAKGPTAISAGIYGGEAGPRSAVFADVTGDKLSFDLVGGNGLASHRKLSAGPTFDVKKAVKLDPREASFNVEAKTASGEAVTTIDTARVTPSRFYVFYKNVRGEVRLLSAGVLTKAK